MSNRNYDVTALGELLIDFTENGTSAQGNPIMEANPGGAPCNVLAMLGAPWQEDRFYRKSWKGYVRKPAERLLWKKLELIQELLLW